jgi:hypothetical protein
MSVSKAQSLLIMSVSLQVALAAETHVAEGLTLRTSLTATYVEQSLSILVGRLQVHWQDQIWKITYFVPHAHKKSTIT